MVLCAWTDGWTGQGREGSSGYGKPVEPAPRHRRMRRRRSPEHSGVGGARVRGTCPAFDVDDTGNQLRPDPRPKAIRDRESPPMRRSSGPRRCRRRGVPEAILATVREHFEKKHLSPDQAGLMAQRAGVRALSLTHDATDPENAEEMRPKITVSYKGPVTFARDLDVF